MKIYNTLTGQKEDLVQPKRGALKLFVCGPTVYDLPHLGHARVYVFFDVFKKYLKSLGMKVKYLQNITDIDDRIIERAREEDRTVKEVAGNNEKAYLKTMKQLGVTGVDDYARASDHIKEMIKQIGRLMEKGFAYKTPHGVYFEVKKFPDYGKLSKQNLDELRPGWRIEPDAEKKDPLDFALWKFKKNAYEPSWKSPWGEGRPGWHIEDTAITEKYFGPQYDLHGGGMDLKFPHHESEIAQQEAASGLKPFVKLWMHVGFLMVNGEKMSKSLKNFITVADFFKTRSVNILRFIIFQHHYRSPIDYTDEVVRQSAAALDGIAQFLAKLKMTRVSAGGRSTSGGKKLPDHLDISAYEKHFQAALADDLNTARALATIYGFISDVNKKIWNLSRADAKKAAAWVNDCLKLFGIELKIPKIPSKIEALAKKRELCRISKKFNESDRLRNDIEALGYIIEDTPIGPFLWQKKIS